MIGFAGLAAFVLRTRALRRALLVELARELPSTHLYHRVWVSGLGAKSEHDETTALDCPKAFAGLLGAIRSAICHSRSPHLLFPPQRPLVFANGTGRPRARKA